MSIVKRLLAFLNKENQKQCKEQTPEGFCPNCWGREEYGGKFYEASLKNGKELGWVQNYAKKYLREIALRKKGDVLACSNCKLTYRPIDE